MWELLYFLWLLFSAILQLYLQPCQGVIQLYNFTVVLLFQQRNFILIRPFQQFQLMLQLLNLLILLLYNILKPSNTFFLDNFRLLIRFRLSDNIFLQLQILLIHTNICIPFLQHIRWQLLLQLFNLYLQLFNLLIMHQILLIRL